MRPAIAAAALCLAPLAIGATRSAGASGFPYQATINSPNVYVRSGPGEEYYPTDRLPQGATVTVYRHDPGGWYAVRPPEGSFSWVRADMVEAIDHRRARVRHERAASRVGSSFSDARDVIQVQLERGEEVEVLEAQRFQTAEGIHVWYRIAPPAGEFRWVFGRFLDAEMGRPVAGGAPATTTTPLASAHRRRSAAAHAALAHHAVAGSHYKAPRRAASPRTVVAEESPGGEPRAAQPTEDAANWLAAAERADEQGETIDTPRASAGTKRRAAGRRVSGYSADNGDDAPASHSAAHADQDGHNAPPGNAPGSRLDQPFDPETGEPVDDDAEMLYDEPAQAEVTGSGLAEAETATDTAAADTQPSEFGGATGRQRYRARGTTFPAESAARSQDLAGSVAAASARLAQPLTAELTEAEFRQALADLDLALSAQVIGDTTQWQLDPLTARAQELLGRAETSLERGHVRLVAKKIARFAEIQRRSSGRIEESAHLLTGTPLERPLASHFDGTGKLMRVVAGRSGDPAFALVDRQGLVRYYVTPAPGLNLRHYVGREVGLQGSIGYWPELNTQHVTAQRVTLLDQGLPRR